MRGRLAVPVALLVLAGCGLGLVGCGGGTPSDAGSASASALPTEGLPPDVQAAVVACDQVNQLMNSMTADPDAAQARDMASRLEQIQAPASMKQRIGALATALRNAGAARNGFAEDSATGKAFASAVENLVMACAKQQIPGVS